MEKTFRKMKVLLANLETETNELKAAIKKDLARHDEKLQLEHNSLRDANRALSKVNEEFKQVLT